MSSEVDADEYFAAENLLNAVADFGWNGNMLQVTFGTVPEPAGVAALLGLPRSHSPRAAGAGNRESNFRL